MDYIALKNEINTDPTTRGYGAFLPDRHSAIASLLNEIQAGISINKSSLTISEIRDALDFSEVAALSVAANQALNALMTGDQIDPNNSNISSAFASIFGGGTSTRANLVALKTRTGSRAEELFGENTTVTPKDVAKALKA